MFCLHFLMENFDWSKRFSDADGCNYDWFPLCDLFLFGNSADKNISQPSQVYVSVYLRNSKDRLALIQVETS